MGLFTKKIGPVFLKETSDTSEFIEKMQVLKEEAAGDTRKAIEKQISLAKYGEIGENNVAFELKSSGMDMYILHDIYLETEALSAQIDYLVVTRKHIYVIECKNLIGNIEIDSNGNFVRTYEYHEKTDNIDDVKRRLKAWRLEKSRSEGNKPYYIFNDAQMEDLIEKNPKTKEELLKVSGFGAVKVEKYGEDILKILANRI